MHERDDTRNRYGKHTLVCESSKRDTSLRSVKDWKPTEAQVRFLSAYAERPFIASAAQRAGVARCTVYRWLANIPPFEKAVRGAYGRSLVAAKRRSEAWQEERRLWREERAKAWYPMRCANLAKARAAYREARNRRRGAETKA